jgi:hypothetical protein
VKIDYVAFIIGHSHRSFGHRWVIGGRNIYSVRLFCTTKWYGTTQLVDVGVEDGFADLIDLDHYSGEYRYEVRNYESATLSEDITLPLGPEVLRFLCGRLLMIPPAFRTY